MRARLLCIAALFIPCGLSIHTDAKGGWFLIPALCLAIVLLVRHEDYDGVLLYWAMLSVQFWLVLLSAYSCARLFYGPGPSLRGGFLAASLWLLLEMHRFLSIELSDAELLGGLCVKRGTIRVLAVNVLPILLGALQVFVI